MKNLVIRTVFTLTLLLALGAVLGGVTSPSAHAATRSTSSKTSLAKTPQINIINCSGPTLLIIYSNTAGAWCFANSGSTPATIPAVWEVCSHNTPGYVTFETQRPLYLGSSGCVPLPTPDTLTSVTIY